MSSRTDWSVKQKWSEHRSVGSDSLQPHGLYSPWNFPGQNAWVDSLSLLQGIFPTQGSNPGVPYRRQILYQLSHQGNPRILEWVAYPFSRESSKPRNQTGASCIAGRFFTNWAVRETQWNRSISAINKILLCTRHCCKHFKSIKAFSPHKTSIG